MCGYVSEQMQQDRCLATNLGSESIRAQEEAWAL